MTITIDASVWVAARFPNEPGYAESSACLLTALAQREPIVMPWIAWVECVAAVARKTGKPALALETGQHLREIPAIRWIPFDEADTADAVNVAAAYRLRAADTLYVAVARGHDATLITLDQEVQRRCSVFVRCQSPGGWTASREA